MLMEIWLEHLGGFVVAEPNGCTAHVMSCTRNGLSVLHPSAEEDAETAELIAHASLV